MEREINVPEADDPGSFVRASVAGWNAALTVTSEALIIAESQPCGPQRRVRRYPLGTVCAIRFLEDLDGSLLTLEFSNGERRAVLFPRHTTSTAKRLVCELDSEVQKLWSATGHPRYQALLNEPRLAVSTPPIPQAAGTSPPLRPAAGAAS